MPFKLGPLEVVLILVIFMAVIVPLIIVLVVYFARRASGQNMKSTAVKIAEQRYARGEISAAELQEIKKNLT